MIARDEEENLPRALESVRDLAAEIVVVDTGSVDATQEIAASFGARVIEHPWNDDFSEAKNVALDNAAGDWILFLDADEYVCPESKGEIAAAMAGEADAYFVRIESEVRSGAGRVFVNLLQRLFRNGKGIRYEGAVHEQIDSSLVRIGARVEMSRIVLKHTGYGLKSAEFEAKLRRNLGILRKVLDDRPDDAVSWFHAGEAHAMLGDCGAAVAAYEKALESGRLPAEFVPVVKQNLASSLIRKGAYERAMRLLSEAVEMDPGLLTVHMLLASALFGLGKYERAEREIMTYISRAQGPAKISVPLLGFKEDIPAAMVLIAKCRLARGDVDKATEVLKDAVKAAPDLADAHVLLGRIAFENMDFPGAASRFEKALELMPFEERLYFELARSYMAAGATDRAAECIERALARGIESAGLLRCLGLIRVKQQDFEAAVSAYEGALRLEPGDAEAARKLAGLHHVLGRDDVAREYLTICK